MNFYPILYEKGKIFTEEKRMTGRGSLQHGKYINQGSTRRIKPVADIYIYMKRFLFVLFCFLNKELTDAIMEAS